MWDVAGKRAPTQDAAVRFRKPCAAQVVGRTARFKGQASGARYSAKSKNVERGSACPRRRGHGDVVHVVQANTLAWMFMLKNTFVSYGINFL